jgi:hypothetical protein
MRCVSTRRAPQRVTDAHTTELQFALGLALDPELKVRKSSSPQGVHGGDHDAVRNVSGGEDVDSNVAPGGECLAETGFPTGDGNAGGHGTTNFAQLNFAFTVEVELQNSLLMNSGRCNELRRPNEEKPIRFIVPRPPSRARKGHQDEGRGERSDQVSTGHTQVRPT